MDKKKIATQESQLTETITMAMAHQLSIIVRYSVNQNLISDIHRDIFIYYI